MNQDRLKEIKVALIEQKLYNPHGVFQHAPEFYPIDDDRYECEVRCIKWNTRSTRMSVYYPRFDENKDRWVFARKRGQKRTPHGEKMR